MDIWGLMKSYLCYGSTLTCTLTTGLNTKVQKCYYVVTSDIALYRSAMQCLEKRMRAVLILI